MWRRKRLLSWNTILIIRIFGFAQRKSRSLNLVSGIKVHSITKEIQTFFQRLSQWQETKCSFGFGKLYCGTVSVLKPELFSLKRLLIARKVSVKAKGTSSRKANANAERTAEKLCRRKHNRKAKVEKTSLKRLSRKG